MATRGEDLQAGTEVSDETRRAEQEDEQIRAKADRAPTAEEEQAAETNEPVADSVAQHEKEMADLGAKVKGEGEIVP